MYTHHTHTYIYIYIYTHVYITCSAQHVTYDMRTRHCAAVSAPRVGAASRARRAFDPRAGQRRASPPGFWHSSEWSEYQSGVQGCGV